MIQVKMKTNDYQYKLTENVHHSIRIHIEIKKIPSVEQRHFFRK